MDFQKSCSLLLGTHLGLGFWRYYIFFFSFKRLPFFWTNATAEVIMHKAKNVRTVEVPVSFILRSGTDVFKLIVPNFVLESSGLQKRTCHIDQDSWIRWTILCRLWWTAEKSSMSFTLWNSSFYATKTVLFWTPTQIYAPLDEFLQMRIISFFFCLKIDFN